jgi:hypothetical protein
MASVQQCPASWRGRETPDSGDWRERALRLAREATERLMPLPAADLDKLSQARLDAARLWMDATLALRLRNRKLSDACYDVALLLAQPTNWPPDPRAAGILNECFNGRPFQTGDGQARRSAAG